jgi:aspartate-semialdehyde dehydrogenase
VRVAIVHPTGLVAQELRERLDRLELPVTEVRLLSTDQAEVGTVTEAAGAATFVQPYDADTLADLDWVFFCGPVAANRPLLGDLDGGTRGLLLSPDASPSDAPPLVAGVNLDGPALAAQVLASPHPGVVLLAHLLHRLRSLGLAGAEATILQPASLFGSSALDDLMGQARDLLSFQPLAESETFGATQLVFNLLPAEIDGEVLGEQLAAVVGGAVAAEVDAVQAGVFHSLAASLHVRLEGEPSTRAVEAALRQTGLVRVAGRKERLGPVDAAASEEILVGPVRASRRHPGSFWVWSVMDNLTRGGTLNALAIVAAAG